MDRISELLEHMDRAALPAITVEDQLGTVVAVLVRVQHTRAPVVGRGMVFPLTARPGGRTPKGTVRSRRQRQAAKHARLRKGDA